jgi:CMP-N,N'-diacetyllegionaminic acid synthase
MKFIVVIPARGGSKRLPKKNLRLLGGKPLIYWTIKLALSLPINSDVILSSDDDLILEYGKKFENLLLLKREAYLSTDTASSVDVAIDAINWYENKGGQCDSVILLQPTSPFRDLIKITNAIHNFALKRTSLVSVSLVKDHPNNAYKLVNGSLKQLNVATEFGVRKQDLSEIYSPNGNIYISDILRLKNTKSFNSEGSIPLIINSEIESIDIDTEFDFDVANIFISKYYQFRG